MGKMYTPVPCDTQKVLKKNRNKCDNNYLLLNKFLKDEKTEKFDTTKTKEELYHELKSNSQDLKPHKERFKHTIKRLEKSGYATELFTLQTDSRMVVGLGDANALEVGLTLHPLYGFPYIPGSSLKGLCRTWLEIAEDTFENGNVLEGRDLDSKIKKESLAVFGSADKDEQIRNNLKDEWKDSQRGNVLFFDAIPTESPELDVDIMTPHYGPYYDKPEKNPPGDWYSPNIIKFLTVAKSQEFLFGLADRDRTSLNKAKKWLIFGLCELGIGAKTSSGYGYFLHPDVLEQRKKDEERKKQEARPDWAVEQEKKRLQREKMEQEKTSEQKIQELIASGKPQKNYYNAYTEWKKLPDSPPKKKLAKLFFDEESRYMKKKKKKKWANELRDYLGI